MQPLNSQNDPGDQKNMLLAILLSVCVLLAWQFFYANPKVQQERERRQAIETQQKAQPRQGADQVAGQPPAAGASAPSATTGVSVDGAPPVPDSDGQAGNAPVALSVSRNAALSRANRVEIVTPSITGSFNLTSGRIDDIELVKYHETPDPSTPKIVLFSPTGAPQPYFAEHGWVPGPNEKVKLPGPNTPWEITGEKRLTPQKPLPFAYTRPTVDVDIIGSRLTPTCARRPRAGRSTWPSAAERRSADYYAAGSEVLVQR